MPFVPPRSVAKFQDKPCKEQKDADHREHTDDRTQAENTARKVAICRKDGANLQSGGKTAIRNNGDRTINQVKDEKNSDTNWIEEIALNEAKSRLSEREKKVLDLRFFQGRTQMEVAEEIDISQAQVSRLEKNALKHMRAYLT